MQSNTPRRPSGISDVSPVSNDDSLAGPVAWDARQARPGDGPAGSSGAAPSNTAPDNSIGEYFKALRWGVDSLYLSHAGVLDDRVHERLVALKKMAQDKERPLRQAVAQYPLGDQVFIVRDKGSGFFPFLLDSPAFRIRLSRGEKIPMAHTQVSAEYLAHVGPVEAERRLNTLLHSLGHLEGFAKVSRIDLFVDFVWTGSMEWNRAAWITHAEHIDTYSERGVFSGWVIGRGGAMLARLYDKRLQASKIGAEYLAELWKAVGWQDHEPVWRLEFQIRRDVLVQMGLGGFREVQDNLDGLWSYAMTDWLRLALPQEGDKTRSRWPVHPLWGYLSSIDWQGSGGPLSRSFKTTMAPADTKFYSLYLAAMTGYLAKHLDLDMGKAQEAIHREAMRYYGRRAEKKGKSLEEYVEGRVALKVRQYGTELNDPDGLARLDEELSEQAALTYRKASRGG